MNSALMWELSDGEEMVVEARSNVVSADPRDREIEARRRASEAFQETNSPEPLQ